jgi:flotillin|nr:MAG TPA: hypothetical protein [Caudoviricetes sp.]
MIEVIGTVVPVVIAVGGVGAIIGSGYVKASPDKAYIISGLRKTPKTLIGKAGLKIPFFEKADHLNLELIPIDVKTSSSVPTADYININVDAAVNVKVSSNPERLKLAAENFLNKPVGDIGQVAREVLEGNMREIVGKMSLEEMVSDRQKFAQLVTENAKPDLAAMGLDIISFNVQNFMDDNDVIENLGVDNVVKIKKKAAISRAESERDIEKAKAMAEKEANDAKVESATAIAEKNNNLEIKKSELEKISKAKKAEADAAYKIQEEKSRKEIEVVTADANIMRQEKEIELKRKDVEVTEQTLDAQIKKQAEAERYASQQKADADLYKKQKESEANKYAMEQEAEGIRAKGVAEAEAIKAKGIAEAEAIEKKAEAMKQMGKASIVEMMCQMFPEAVKNAAAPLGNVGSITMYGEGNTTKLTKDIMNVVNQVSDGVKGSTGVDLAKMLKDFVSEDNEVESTDNVGQPEVYSDDYREF